MSRMTDRNTIELLSAASATNSAPSAATDGFDLKYWAADDATIVVDCSAASGTRSFSGIVWLYYEGGQDNNSIGGVWCPAGTSDTFANRGMLNEGNALSDTADFTHAERIIGLRDATRIYLEVDATPGGTSPSVDAWLVRRGGQR